MTAKVFTIAKSVTFGGFNYLIQPPYVAVCGGGRFGLWMSYPSTLDAARQAERAGYEVVLVTAEDQHPWAPLDTETAQRFRKDLHLST